MPKYRFEQIAINSTEKRKPTESDMATYIGLEHMDSHSLTVKRWGSDVPIIGEKLVMRKGDVLLGKRNAYLRRAAIAPFDGLFSAHGMVLRPRTDIVDKDFFPIFIASDYFFDEAIRISVGSLSPTINWKDLKGVEFNLPTLEEQKKLAKILWSIIKTTNSYQEMLEKQDLLIKSQFIEMFKDELKGKTTKLKDITDVITKGTTPTTLGFNFEDEGINFVKVECITDSHKFLINKMLHISEECNSKLKRSILKNNDVLFSIAGAIGRTAVVTNDILPANTNQALSIIRLNKNSGLIPVFLNEMLNTDFIRDQFYEKANGSTQINLSLADVENFNVIIPSLSKQNEFYRFVNQIDKSKFEIEKSLNSLKKIYEKVLRDNF